jgi:hypothetical protein
LAVITINALESTRPQVHIDFFQRVESIQMGDDGVSIAYDFDDDCVLGCHDPPPCIMQALRDILQAVRLGGTEVGLTFNLVPFQHEWNKSTPNTKLGHKIRRVHRRVQRVLAWRLSPFAAFEWTC